MGLNGLYDDTSVRKARGVWRGGRGRGRPWLNSPVLQAERRKIRLAEALELCRDDEVVDVAGPRILNEVTSLMAKVSAVASQYLQPLHNDPNAEAFQLKNQRTARLIDLQCGTYFISKDDRKILEDHSLLDETLTADADATVNLDTIHTSCVDDQKLKEEESTTTTDLWDALEEATSHLPPTGADESIVSGGTDTEMLQVDEIVNRVV